MAYYNFLPPFDQVYPDLPATGSFIPVPTDIGNINRLDQYLPSYDITTGELIELQVDGSGIPQNLQGIPGPTGPGLSGVTGPATPFMMVAYGQTSQGIVQFTLCKGGTIPTTYEGAFYDASNEYIFAPVNDTLDYSRVVQIFYTIDISQNGVNGAPSGNTNAVRFFDAERVVQNPSSSVYNYELLGNTTSSFKIPNSNATWPYKKENNTDLSTSLYFYFNELKNKTNPNQERLFSGQFYHPYFIGMTAIGGDVPNDFITYNTDSYYNGYGPGYPININYDYAPILLSSRPVIENPVDGIFQVYPNYQSTGSNYVAYWPGPVTLNVYNFSVNNITNYPSFATGGTINNVCDNSFLYCSCNDNNSCGGSSDSYYTNNQNSVQAGIANYLTYQFIPFTQIRTPPGFIVTDPQNPGNTGYTYVTLPYNGTTEFEPTPVGVSGTTFYGSYAIQSEILIDPTVGPTGATPAQPSIISGWINNPLSLTYQCNREVSNTSVCGFLDYYDSLFGVAYNYGTCGTTGPSEDPYQKGACPSNQICVPNFTFLQQYDSTTTQPFICVSGSTGVSYANLSSYTQAIPPKTLLSPIIQLPQYGVQKVNPPVEKTKENDNVWLYIGIILLVIIIGFVIFLIYKGFPKSNDYSNLTRIEFR